MSHRTRRGEKGSGAKRQQEGFMQRSRLVLGCLAAVLACTGLLFASASSGNTRAVINPSPVFTNEQLSAPSGDNWYEYYGDLSGSRYSSLNQINASNVGTLKQVWQMSLGSCSASIVAGNPVVPGAPR